MAVMIYIELCYGDGQSANQTAYQASGWSRSTSEILANK